MIRLAHVKGRWIDFEQVWEETLIEVSEHVLSGLSSDALADQMYSARERGDMETVRALRAEIERR